ncbi:hypothetical protein ABPG75_000883 [Micractinium tetrahymenae]
MTAAPGAAGRASPVAKEEGRARELILPFCPVDNTSGQLLDPVLHAEVANEPKIGGFSLFVPTEGEPVVFIERLVTDYCSLQSFSLSYFEPVRAPAVAQKKDKTNKDNKPRKKKNKDKKSRK